MRDVPEQDSARRAGSCEQQRDGPSHVQGPSDSARKLMYLMRQLCSIANLYGRLVFSAPSAAFRALIATPSCACRATASLVPAVAPANSCKCQACAGLPLIAPKSRTPSSEPIGYRGLWQGLPTRHFIETKAGLLWNHSLLLLQPFMLGMQWP